MLYGLNRLQSTAIAAQAGGKAEGGGEQRLADGEKRMVIQSRAYMK